MEPPCAGRAPGGCGVAPHKTLSKGAPTSSMYSGSEADASQRLFRMKMFGRDRRSLTLWKNCFSCARGKGLCGGVAMPAKALSPIRTDILGVREKAGKGYRLHQGGLRVSHQHKHIRIQAKLVNPAVQLCGDIDARAKGDSSNPPSGTQTMSPILPAFKRPESARHSRNLQRSFWMEFGLSCCILPDCLKVSVTSICHFYNNVMICDFTLGIYS